jgi:hypothetical protein
MTDRHLRACWTALWPFVRVMPRASNLGSNDPPSGRFEEAWDMWLLKVEKDHRSASLALIGHEVAGADDVRVSEPAPGQRMGDLLASPSSAPANARITSTGSVAVADATRLRAHEAQSESRHVIDSTAPD